jgi:hypothetical protein
VSKTYLDFNEKYANYNISVYSSTIMSLPLLCFLQMNCDIDFYNVVLSDPSVTESSSSPYLTASDNMLLNPAYWIQHPPQFCYLMQQISTLLPALESDLGTQNHDWVADL